MFKNHIVFFFRNLQRQKLFSFINLLGLTVSIVSTLVIYLYVRHEFSFDRFHKDADRIYRINQTFISPDKRLINSVNAIGIFVKAIKTEFVTHI